jgi:hypothetical protein
MLDSHEPGNRVLREVPFPFGYLKVFARDGDLVAVRLGLTELRVLQLGEESSLAPWLAAIDPQGLVSNKGNRATLLCWWTEL